MAGSKWFVWSRMVWGVVFFALGVYGVEVPEDVKTTYPELTAQFVDSTLQLVGLFMAAYGARKAEKDLTVFPRVLPVGAKLPWRGGL